MQILFGFGMVFGYVIDSGAHKKHWKVQAVVHRILSYLWRILITIRDAYLAPTCRCSGIHGGAAWNLRVVIYIYIGHV